MSAVETLVHYALKGSNARPPPADSLKNGQPDLHYGRNPAPGQQANTHGRRKEPTSLRTSRTEVAIDILHADIDATQPSNLSLKLQNKTYPSGCTVPELTYSLNTLTLQQAHPLTTTETYVQQLDTDIESLNTHIANLALEKQTYPASPGPALSPVAVLLSSRLGLADFTAHAIWRIVFAAGVTDHPSLEATTPWMHLTDWIYPVLDYSDLDIECVFVALKYLRRTILRLDQSTLQDLNQQDFLNAIILACFALAAKWHNDDYAEIRSNRLWSVIAEAAGGIPMSVQQVHDAERIILFTLKYNLHVTTRQFLEWSSVLMDQMCL
ncbi:hypothetical protein HDU76_006038, partial [Blyttiomyces sp. JEL0837]